MSIIKKILKNDKTENLDKKVPSKKEVSDVQVSKNKPEAEKKVESAPKATAKSSKLDKKDDSDAYKILEKPLITEKATDLSFLNKYIFAVPQSATKNEIAKKITNVYGVKPVRINVVNMKGKKVRFGRRFGKKKDWKKAIVTLAPEDKIEIYEGV